MATEAAYGGGVKKGSVQQHQSPQPSAGGLVFCTPDGNAVYAKPAIPPPPLNQQPSRSNAIVPAAPGLAHSSATSEPFKRKCGRPRKYGATAPAPAASEVSPTIPTGFAPSPQALRGGVVSPQASPAVEAVATSGAPAVKKRGRPPGPSSKKQQPPQAAAPVVQVVIGSFLADAKMELHPGSSPKF